MSVETVLQAYQQLSKGEQVLFQRMIQNQDSSAHTEDLSPEWKAEINRRWEAYKNGEMEVVDGRDVQKRIAEKYGF